MINEIKFKAKHLFTKEWVYGYFVKYPDGSGSIFLVDQYDSFPVDPNTVCQSTLEYDKNYKELFIGDMINDFGGGISYENEVTGEWEVRGDNTRIGIIVFEEGRTCIKTKEMSYSYNLSNASKLCDMEYIGNIYDE
ncbi:YopX family protein [Flavobacterium tructae]|uniref:YopX protein domain-containing protein n=1 Tax=Flavobacterium tructae TaxID=1114873 RepID=A0A1S1J5J5_9FLAO|nr:YopX family protein [Flavobacterium tructae]OHT44446.1 hypothetical protein BHE19_12055 [Flavobacterium tructae]OXB19418.1 hypothetical protein B0A71_12815 [Flavobacterium tructae]